VSAHLRLRLLVSVFLNRNLYLKAYSLLVPLVTLITAWFSDRYTSRGIAVALVYLPSVAGFALYLGNVLVLCQVSCSKCPILIRRQTHWATTDNDHEHKCIGHRQPRGSCTTRLLLNSRGVVA
jgi:hypothetical protein